MLEYPPKVTIGIPVYNEEKYIAETLLSAVNQSYKDIQIIVSDNASTDGTAKIVREMAEVYPQIILIEQEKNIGSMKNFVFVMDKADTEYFTWQGGHDIMSPYLIEKLITAHKMNSNMGLSLVYAQSQTIDEKGVPQNVFLNSNIDTHRLNNIWGPLKIFRTLGAGTAIHGLFKTELLQPYKIKEIAGTDAILLFHTAIQGKILALDEVLYFRREYRKESNLEKQKRYESYGMVNSSKVNPYKEMLQEHYDYIIQSPKISFFRKFIFLALGLSLLKIRVFHYNWKKRNRHKMRYLRLFHVGFLFIRQLRHKIFLVQKENVLLLTYLYRNIPLLLLFRQGKLLHLAHQRQ